MNMDGEPYVYQRNIHIQQCVHDVHSEDPVKKILKIRYTLTERTIIFITKYTLEKIHCI
jgi:hypothetical protein